MEVVNSIVKLRYEGLQNNLSHILEMYSFTELFPV